MKMFLRFLHSDFLKIRRSPVLWVHILVPFVGITLFLLPCFFKPTSAGSMAGNILGAIALSFPILIGLICSMTVEQESDAGNFQELLTRPSKLISFFSMVVMLLLLGLGASLLASFGFEAGLAVCLHQTPFHPNFYLHGALLVFGSNIFIYLLHLFLSLRFNKSVSIGVGIVESMLAALLLTGLGDGIWTCIPCAWGLRFVKMFMQNSFGRAMPMNKGIVSCCIETALILVFSIIWFLHWEGKKTEG